MQHIHELVNHNLIDKENWTKRAIFLVWGPPSHGRRSTVLARELGIEALHFVYGTTRRGPWVAPFKYSYQTFVTLLLLFRIRPELVFVQSPPSFAVLTVYFYCKLTRARFVVDAHSDALQRWCWTFPTWLSRAWARAAITTIVTNEYFQAQIQKWGGNAFILRDIPTRFDKQANYPVNGSFNVVVVNTFSNDEPIGQILAAAQKLPDVHFYVTGKKERAAPRLLAATPSNVYFTDYLPDASYYGLLEKSDAVMCLTTRNHTMQRGACEALSLGKPIITSDWPLLRDYFHKGTVHVANDSESIGCGILEMVEWHAVYQTEIKELQRKQRQEWEQKLHALGTAIQ